MKRNIQIYFLIFVLLLAFMSATKTSLRKKHHQHETIAFNEVNN